VPAHGEYRAWERFLPDPFLDRLKRLRELLILTREYIGEGPGGGLPAPRRCLPPVLVLKCQPKIREKPHGGGRKGFLPFHITEFLVVTARRASDRDLSWLCA
jgi:hypothetical protein